MYLLRVLDRFGNKYDVIGAEEVLRIAYDEYFKLVSDKLSNIEHEMFRVSGYTDNYERDAYDFQIAIVDIAGMFLTKL